MSFEVSLNVLWTIDYGRLAATSKAYILLTGRIADNQIE
jgi:hypothetical protein